MLSMSCDVFFPSAVSEERNIAMRMLDMLDTCDNSLQIVDINATQNILNTFSACYRPCGVVVNEEICMQEEADTHNSASDVVAGAPTIPIEMQSVSETSRIVTNFIMNLNSGKAPLKRTYWMDGESALVRFMVADNFPACHNAESVAKYMMLFPDVNEQTLVNRLKKELKEQSLPPGCMKSFSESEFNLFVQLVKENEATQHKDWSMIASHFPGKALGLIQAQYYLIKSVLNRPTNRTLIPKAPQFSQEEIVTLNWVLDIYHASPPDTIKWINVMRLFHMSKPMSEILIQCYLLLKVREDYGGRTMFRSAAKLAELIKSLSTYTPRQAPPLPPTPTLAELQPQTHVQAQARIQLPPHQSQTSAPAPFVSPRPLVCTHPFTRAPEWSVLEDKRLKSLLIQYEVTSNKWNEILKHFPGRSESNVQGRAHLLFANTLHTTGAKHALTQGSLQYWSIEDILLLKVLLRKYDITNEQHLRHLCDQFPHRDAENVLMKTNWLKSHCPMQVNSIDYRLLRCSRVEAQIEMENDNNTIASLTSTSDAQSSDLDSDSNLSSDETGSVSENSGREEMLGVKRKTYRYSDESSVESDVEVVVCKSRRTENMPCEVKPNDLSSAQLK